MLAIIIGILLFMFLVIVHELGHFIAAKKSGVKVLEFGIGIPPKMFTYYTDKSGTEYTLNWLPLGGFVRLKGESPTEPDDFFAKDSFISAKLWKKLVILVGGVTMNLIFAWLLFTAAFWKGIEPLQVMPVNMIGIESESYIMPSYSFLQKQGLISGELLSIPVKIEMVVPDSLAEKNGIMSGDVITKIDGKNIDTLNLSPVLKDLIGKTFSLEYKRGEEIKTVQLSCPPDSCLMGIVMSQGGQTQIKPIKFGLVDSMGAALHEIKAQTYITFLTLGNLVKNLVSFNGERIKSSVEKMSGPVGAVKVGEIIMKEFGLWQYLAFGGMISLALAIFNILPIPALDGGRAVGVLIQALFRLKPEKYFTVENYFNLLFFVVLMGLGVYIILLDLYRFWGVKIPFIG